MRFKLRSPCLILLSMVLLILPQTARAADVDVYAEGAYNESYLDVYIYANINVGNLCSYGVTLYYNVNKVTPVSATKNDAVWYFGTPASKLPYVDPDTTTPGQIVFIGGKLDTGNPTAGVTGTRVLLGTVRFVRAESSLNLGTGAQNYFGISLEPGKPSPYDNFVTTGGVVRDGGVGFGPVRIFRRGDANADGIVNVQDIGAVRFYMTSGGIANPWKDCNEDGVINVQDIGCIRYIMTN